LNERTGIGEWIVGARWRSLCFAVLLSCLVVPAAHCETRAIIVALDYKNAEESSFYLPNTLPDGRKIEKALKAAKVRDVELLINPTSEQLSAELLLLRSRMRPDRDDVALVYFAGHAQQVNGENYLIDATGRAAISLDLIVEQVTGSSDGAGEEGELFPSARSDLPLVFFVDACRTNPYRKQAASTLTLRAVGTTRAPPKAIPLTDLRANPNGLAQMATVRGGNRLIVFSTDPGNVAQDGKPGEGSPFANAIAVELRKRQELKSFLDAVSTRVTKATKGAQTPWPQGSILGQIYLTGHWDGPVP
jgi:uncharacterized caspase-like protein